MTIVLAVAVAAACDLWLQAYVARLDFQNLTVGSTGPIAAIVRWLDGSELFVWLKLLTYPVLALTVGFSLAQASGSQRASSDYKMAFVYMRLAELASQALNDPRFQDPRAFLSSIASALSQTRQLQNATAAGLEALLSLITSPTGESAAMRDLCADIVALIAFRRLSATLNEHPDIDGTYTHEIILNFETIGEQGIHQRQFFPMSKHSLRLHLFSENITLERDLLNIELPSTGRSTSASLGLRLNMRGGKLRVMVTPLNGADVLQEVVIRIDLR